MIRFAIHKDSQDPSFNDLVVVSSIDHSHIKGYYIRDSYQIRENVSEYRILEKEEALAIMKDVVNVLESATSGIHQLIEILGSSRTNEEEVIEIIKSDASPSSKLDMIKKLSVFDLSQGILDTLKDCLDPKRVLSKMRLPIRMTNQRQMSFSDSVASSLSDLTTRSIVGRVGLVSRPRPYDMSLDNNPF